MNKNPASQNFEDQIRAAADTPEADPSFVNNLRGPVGLSGQDPFPQAPYFSNRLLR